MGFITDIFGNPIIAIVCIIAAVFLMKLFKAGKGIFKFCIFVFLAWVILRGFGG